MEISVLLGKNWIQHLEHIYEPVQQDDKQRVEAGEIEGNEAAAEYEAAEQKEERRAWEEMLLNAKKIRNHDRFLISAMVVHLILHLSRGGHLYTSSTLSHSIFNSILSLGFPIAATAKCW